MYLGKFEGAPYRLGTGCESCFQKPFKEKVYSLSCIKSMLILLNLPKPAAALIVMVGCIRDHMSANPVAVPKIYLKNISPA